MARDKRPICVQYALLTLLAVFKDVIPGYRIRKWTEAEEKGQLSKEVRRLRVYEGSLLNSYQNYLQTLEDIAQGLPFNTSSN